MVRPAPDFEPRKPLTKKQELVLAVLEEFGSVSVKELCYYSGVTRIVVENLRKAGAVELYEQKRGVLFQHVLEKYPDQGASVYEAAG